jgi:hypothetical protein
VREKFVSKEVDENGDGLNDISWGPITTSVKYAVFGVVYSRVPKCCAMNSMLPFVLLPAAGYNKLSYQLPAVNFKLSPWGLR